MYSESKHAMQCAEFDQLLGAALDGALSPADMERFETHRSACVSCGPLFAEAQSGMNWLHSLKEVDPPANLVHNILAATVGRVEAAPAEAPSETLWQRLRAAALPFLGPVLQPKVAMSFAMAFFSITLLLNVAGVRAAELKHLDLRPSALLRGYYETQGRLVKYYENIRFVYEIESRVQQLKRATAPEEKTPPPEQKQRREKGGESDRKYQNYSREDESVIVAQWFEQELVSGRRIS